MAKRKRLSPAAAVGAELETKSFTGGWHGDAYGRAPIADVAGEAAAQAALSDLADEVAASRREGRLVVDAPLDAIDDSYLVRDRIAMDEDDLAVLATSLAERGQQMPLEVVDLGQGRYGLISGWRRLTALRRLLEQTGDTRFAEARCLIRQPAESGEAYRAMVEENEIRTGLGFYERARIAVRAAEEGAFADTKQAVKSLFSAVSAPKRSKIRSFVAVYEAFDDVLCWPGGMPERLGLALAGALDADAGFKTRLRAALTRAAPPDAAAERKVLERALKPVKPPAPPADEVAPGIWLEAKTGRLTLTGPGVDATLRAALTDWLTSR